MIESLSGASISVPVNSFQLARNMPNHIYVYSVMQRLDELYQSCFRIQSFRVYKKSMFSAGREKLATVPSGGGAAAPAAGGGPAVPAAAAAVPEKG
jgi:hypothetical protein